MSELTYVLVVDDEVELLELVKTYLQKESYAVLTATSGREAIEFMHRYKVEFVVLDVMMDDMDGFTACERIRSFSQVPILMLTARSGEEDKVKGLKLGADDYMVKPFSPRELIARIEAVLRRSERMNVQTNRLKMGELEVDVNGRMVFVHQEPVRLTRKEYDLLLFLLEHRGQVFTREHLHERIWGMDTEMGTLRTVDTHVKTIRLKLKAAGALLQTVWGIGYKLEELS
ncbi:response regulator transcription factor [Halalkalibacter hemicellulosilyticus]|uniref:Two-component response regulator n=1 Tax=Halalkalibacter hemicellulosilyticusJCM 9152 TaxID=1236971 RepID=W4QL18_9BACI|nr:response regulator transcription factor [Halalkalibacter hemicellulosilyticus]GAE32597.1 two-component response regulator [Halalkalibacter hemicellulosilyticusJCM 9152]